MAGKRGDSPGDAVEIEIVPTAPEVERYNGDVLMDIGATDTKTGATALKLSADGHTVLVPQPSDDPKDPLNWSSLKKHSILMIISLAAFSADFSLAVGIPCVVTQAAEWGVTPNEVVRVGSLSTILSGVGALFWIPFIYWWGRAPVLLWLTFIGAFLTLGTALVQSFAGYYALRALMQIFLSGGQSVGLAFIQDIFFHHEIARKIGIWVAVFMLCPYASPMFGYYIIGATGSWRACFWMTFGLQCVILVLIIIFLDETFYRRDIPKAEQPARGRRLHRAIGLWQIQAHKGYFRTARASILQLFQIVMKPIIVPLLLFYMLYCMWAIGINQTSSVILALPPFKGGYGLKLRSLGFLYFTPIIAVLIGEFVGHWGNDRVAQRYVERHNGILRPEARLTPVYFTLPLTIPGLILVGQALHHHLSWVAIAFGWGMYVAAVMIATVPVTAYALDSYPGAPGEVSAWINFARTLGGFTVGYFQLDWGKKSGYNVSFGIQAGIVAASHAIIIGLHIWGGKLRKRNSYFRAD